MWKYNQQKVTEDACQKKKLRERISWYVLEASNCNFLHIVAYLLEIMCKKVKTQILSHTLAQYFWF